MMEEKQDLENKLEYHPKYNRDESITFSYRRFTLGPKTYHLEYCTGPSLLQTGRTDQLFMTISIEDKDNPDEVEIYNLRRYPYTKDTTTADHIIIKRQTLAVRKTDDCSSLHAFLESFWKDDNKLLEKLWWGYVPKTDIPVSHGEPHDWDMIRMYLKHHH